MQSFKTFSGLYHVWLIHHNGQTHWESHSDFNRAKSEAIMAAHENNCKTIIMHDSFGHVATALPDGKIRTHLHESVIQGMWHGSQMYPGGGWHGAMSGLAKNRDDYRQQRDDDERRRKQNDERRRKQNDERRRNTTSSIRPRTINHDFHNTPERKIDIKTKGKKAKAEALDQMFKDKGIK